MKRTYKKILQLFFLSVFLSISLFAFFWKKNIFSKGDLKLELICPEKLDVLEEGECNIKYKNNSNFRLKNQKLLIIFPPGTLEGENLVETKNYSQEELGEVLYPGEEKNITFKISFLGKEEEKKIIKAVFTFQPQNLKAIYDVNSEAMVLLKRSPLNLDFVLPSKIPVGNDISLRLSYYWNFNQPATDLRVQLELPKGFEMVNSFPKSIDNKEWQIPLINPFQGSKIEIFGKMHGEVGFTPIFVAKIGILKEGKFFVLKEEKKGAELVKPLILIRQEINGNSDYQAMAGDWLHYVIYFKNIGDKELNNLTLISKLEGEAFDFSTLKTDLGIFHPEDNSIIFEWKKIDSLLRLMPTKEGKVEFWIKLKEDLGNVSENTLKNIVFLGEAREEFLTKIGSKPEVVQKAYFQDEVFGNAGPIPFVANQPTTLTIIWQIKNYSSDLKETRVRANLPSFVRLTGKFFPEEFSSKVIFDNNSREISWIVGEVKKGTGIVGEKKSLAFQVEIIPPENQKGKTIEIISGGKIEAFDTWLESKIEKEIPPLKTSDLSDVGFLPEKGIVQ
jgi:hypothetical protein